MMLSPIVTGQEPARTVQQSEQNLTFGDPLTRASTQPKISTLPFVLASDGSVIPATGSMLIRNRDSVFATAHTSGLTPGTAVTFWFGIFNYPINCATTPCTAADFSNPAVQGCIVNEGGKIIGPDGTATYGAFRMVGDITGFGGVGFPVGLLNPMGAEIHLVTRTHGPASNDPMILSQQLSMFLGGCPPNTCTNLQASRHQP
jgi:hypothetical protein